MSGALGASKYVSPDGALTFVVEHQPDDVILGFEGTPWHTHGDTLACEYGLPPEEAVPRFVEALLQDRAVIAIASVEGVVMDVWVADEPLKLDPHKPHDEVVTLRFWSGTPFDQAKRARY
jgi:hypothetical protein